VGAAALLRVVHPYTSEALEQREMHLAGPAAGGCPDGVGSSEELGGPHCMAPSPGVCIPKNRSRWRR